MNRSESVEIYNLVILGSGQAASPLARSAAAAGWKVAVVEEDQPGGTCINTGCTPTKTLVASARAAYVARNSGRWGVNTGVSAEDIRVDWPVVRGLRDKIVDDFRSGSLKGLTGTDGLEYIEGHGELAGSREIKITSGRGGNLSSRRIKAERIVLDVGGHPLIPDIPGLDSVKWVDSAGLQKIEKLPRHLIVLGGGYIGLEFGQMFRRFGCDVSIIHRGEHLLSREDEDIAREMEKILQDEGVQVITGVHPSGITPAVENNEGFTLTLEAATGIPEPDSITADLVLVATGRSPKTENLGLDSAGIQTDKRGFISVNDSLETSAEGIWAVGDCKGGPAFTHIAYDDYRLLRDLWFPPSSSRRTGISGRPVPYTVFTNPQFGRIGLSEKDAAAAGIEVEVYSIPFAWVARALEAGETAGFMKILASPTDGHILGAAVLGMEGGELATMIQLAMAGGLTIFDLKETIFPHPGLAEAFNNLIAYGKRT